jgi:hypothetical protein
MLFDHLKLKLYYTILENWKKYKAWSTAPKSSFGSVRKVRSVHIGSTQENMKLVPTRWIYSEYLGIEGNESNQGGAGTEGS